MYTQDYQFDTLDEYDWESITSHYEDGVLFLRLTIFDSGALSEESFENGQLVLLRESSTYDWDDPGHWYRETAFDATGAVIRIDQTHENRMRTTETFVDGVLRTRTVRDIDATDTSGLEPQDLARDDLKGWRSVEYRYDATGVLEQKITAWDSGIVVDESFHPDGSLGTVVKSDVEDATWWSDIDETYDENGNLVQRVTTHDNGRVTTETYTDGQLTSRLQEDPTDVIWWSSALYTYDTTGALTGKVMTHDDGVVIETLYLEDRTVVSQDDVLDAHWWQFTQTGYDLNGDPFMRMRLHDNGISTVEEWSGGVRTTTHKTDALDAKWWTTITLNYDANGYLVEKETVHDNGMIITETYFEGTLKNKLQWDQGDVRDWDSILTIYDNDLPSIRFTIMDDGTHVNEGFVDGVVSERFTHDMGFLHDWERIEEYYNVEDYAYYNLTTYDNGVEELHATKLNGETSVGAYDGDDVFEWTQMGTLFDPDGVIIEDFTYMDNRELFYDFYDAGVLSMSVLEDFGNNHEWYAQVELFDENGALTDTLYFDNASDLFDATGYSNPLFISA